MDPISIVASAITIGASAAQLSLALFSVVQTIKNAPTEIAEIADEISLLAGSLQTLGEILDAHQDLCKPAFFTNTRSIISRYERVAAEIRLLIDKRRSLVGLKWPLKKPKAKGLLKKVEGIKTALILELNVIRLAREEASRPSPDFNSNGQTHGRPRFNRFRRIVESAVQANRHVVESAQQEDEKLEAATQPSSSAELALWKSGSSDTAPWLYQLVFSSGDTSPPPPYPQTRQLHQASVVDESAETATRSSHASSPEPVAVPERRPSSPDEKAMILWSRQTEPALVVDRLLSSWTTLSPNQISLSSTRQHGVEGVVEDDAWREDILRMVEEAKKDDNLSFDEWEEQNEPVGSDDEAFQSAEEDSMIDTHAPPYNFRSNTQKARIRSAKSSNRTDPRAHSYDPSPTYGDPPSPRRKAREVHVTFGKTSTGHPRQHVSKQRKHGVKPLPAEAETRQRPSKVYTIHSGDDEDDDGVFDRPYRDRVNIRDPRNKSKSGYSNPFRHGHIPPPVNYGYSPPWQEPPHVLPPSEPPRQAYTSDPYPQHPPGHQPTVESPPPSPAQAQAPPMPLHPPPPPAPSVETQTRTAEDEARETAVLARVETLLQKRNQEPRIEYEDSPFSKLAKIFKEQEVQNERERANATAEVYMKQMQDAHEKDEEKMKQLESLVAAQRAEQKRMEIMWAEEKKNMEAKAAKHAQEIRDLAAREIVAAQLAKETAQTALNVERLEAEKEARRKADAMVIAERQRTDEVHKLQLQRYEELLRGIQEHQLTPGLDSNQTTRRTRIAEGNRSEDVTEFATSRGAPLTTSSSASFLEGFRHFYMSAHRAARRDSFHSSAASIHASRTSLGSKGTSDSNPQCQQMIVFPAKADRRSQKMGTLQRSLAGFGIESVFEDAEDVHPLHNSQLIQYDYDNASVQIVKSTIFWESPALKLGSELLLTMRQAGWRPSYTRISEKGQTHYLGSQPVHTYFFDPDYEPQFCPSETAPGKESITIQKALVDEYALIELGFEFQSNDMGLYVLDGSLSYNDIENLIERSFLITENNYRRLHRQLQWHFDKDPEVPLSAYPATYEPSVHSVPSVYSGENSTVCDDTDTETRRKKTPSSAASDADHSDIGDVSNYLVPQFEVSRRSAAPSSVASRTSKSTNPYRKYINAAEDSGVDSVSR